MSNIPTIPPTILSPEHAREFSAILKELTPESAYAFLAEAYELGRKHGRESADAENALLLEASETVHNRTTDNSSAVLIGAVLHAFLSASTRRADGSMCAVALCSENFEWGGEYALHSHDLGAGRTQFVLHPKKA